MMLPNGLAREAVRFKPASFAGTFLAPLMSSMIVSACGILLKTSLRASVPPERYAKAPAVTAADQYVRVATGSGEDREEEATPLPDTARVDAGLAAKAAKAPGAATAVPDFTFPVRAADEGAGSRARELPVPGGVLTAHGWGSHAFTGTALTTGSAPREGEVVLDAGTARAAKAAVRDTVALRTAAGQRDFRVAGVAEAGPADTTRNTGAAGAIAWFADARAPTLAGHPGKADAIAVPAKHGTDTDALAGSVKKALAGSGAEVHLGDDRGAVEDPGLGYAKETLFGIGGPFGGPPRDRRGLRPRPGYGDHGPGVPGRTRHLGPRQHAAGTGRLGEVAHRPGQGHRRLRLRHRAEPRCEAGRLDQQHHGRGPRRLRRHRRRQHPGDDGHRPPPGAGHTAPRRLHPAPGALTMLRWEGLLVSAVGVVLGSAIAAATLIPMMRGMTGEGPYVPPLVYGSFAAAAGGLALLAVTLPARAALRRWS